MSREIVNYNLDILEKISYNAYMTDIEKLKEHYGSYKKVSERLGITGRHLLNLRKGMPPGKPLENLIKIILHNISIVKENE